MRCFGNLATRTAYRMSALSLQMIHVTPHSNSSVRNTECNISQFVPRRASLYHMRHPCSSRTFMKEEVFDGVPSLMCG